MRRLRIRTPLAMAAFCTCFAFAAFASAQETSPEVRHDNRARAQQLFDSALADAEAGNFAAACPKFMASQEADPKTSTLLNLASCYERNNQTASAWGAFREAETLARKAARADWETTARTRAEALEPKLLRVSIVVADADKVNGLVITRDGAHLGPGEWGVAIPVDSGEHVIGASAEGYKSWETRVQVKEPAAGAPSNGPVSVQVPKLEALKMLDAPLIPPPITEPAPPAHWSTWKTIGAIGAGAGVAGIAVGGLLGLIAKGDYNSARAKCAAGSRGCPADAVADSNSAYDLAGGATVVFVAGVALLAAGVTLFFVDPGSASPPRSAGARKPFAFTF